MFTLNQIDRVHNKVKSGADFPLYIQELKNLGVLSYETFVADGHTEFFGEGDYGISSSRKYAVLKIATLFNSEQFKNNLKSHQQGETDYPTFCKDCANSGIEKWVISIEKMTCTYYGMGGALVLIEQIPN